MSCPGCAAGVVAAALGSLKDVTVLKTADFDAPAGDAVSSIGFYTGRMSVSTRRNQERGDGLALNAASMKQYRAVLIVVEIADR